MKPALLFVFVDALGPRQADLLVEAGLQLPHRTSLGGVFGYSSGALATLLTGQGTAAHGRMCLFARWADQTPSPLAPLRWLGLLPRSLHERERVRRWTSRWFARKYGYSGYIALHRVPPELFSTLQLPEKDDIFQTNNLGGYPTFLSQARDAGLRVAVSDWRKPEAERIRDLQTLPQADLSFLYLSGLDAVLHRTGDITDSAKQWAAAAVRWIHQAQHTLTAHNRQVSTVVVGDHGMAPVGRTVNPTKLVKRIRQLDPKAFLFVDSTLLRVTSSSQAVRQIVATYSEGTFVEQTDLEKLGVNVDVYGNSMIVLPEGTIFSPSFVGGNVRGMHGYLPTGASAQAALLSSMALPDTHRLEDVARVVPKLLELPGAGSWSC